MPFVDGVSTFENGISASRLEFPLESANASMHLGQKPPGLPNGRALPHSRHVPVEVMAVIYKRNSPKTLREYENFVAAEGKKALIEFELPLNLLGASLPRPLRLHISSNAQHRHQM